ncbi:MAG: MBOAT family protein [Lachnospiraceae bacterium]|nr:MBOAT family protein [Lachnospiraceae bacterium]
MSLTSVDFLIFAAASLVLYYLFPIRYRFVPLLAADLFFIVRADSLPAVSVMLFMIVLSWGAALYLNGHEERTGADRVVTFGSVICLTGILFALKENRFFVWLLNLLPDRLTGGAPLTAPVLSGVTPLGISYFALVLISYVLEVYWKTERAEKNPLRFAAFAGFFPLLTSGPIVKYNDSYREITEGHAISYRNITAGAQRVLWGFFKKLVISERLAVIVNTVYAEPDVYRGTYAVLAVFLFTLQLYTDFSGCIDICLGVSRMMGITLPENFSLPFMSLTLEEFWRRWHITLGAWLRQYILYPVLKTDLWRRFGKFSRDRLGKRTGADFAKKLPMYCALMISWFMVGFWHGGEWKYIFGVGLLQGGIIVAGQILSPVFVRCAGLLRINRDCDSYRLFCRIRTFAFFSLGLSMFRAQDLHSGFVLWKSFFTYNPWVLFDGSLYELGLSVTEIHILILALAILAAAGLLCAHREMSLTDWLSGQNPPLRWILIIGLLFFVIVYGCYGPGFDMQSFIYANF